MKKIILVLIVFLFLCTGCSSATNIAKYPYNDFGFYDTKTRQYINIGDSKDKIDKILGYEKINKYDCYVYDRSLYIYYDNDNNAERIYYHKPSTFSKDSNIRYELSGGINCNSVVTDFIDLYKHVYYSNDYGIDNVTIFVEKTDKGNFILNKDELIKIQNRAREHGEIYELTVMYNAYDDIDTLEVKKIKNPEIQEWNKILSEI